MELPRKGLRAACAKNKDHQIMMVDPMFMIVQNLKLFLAAVTPTAVAPTADQFGPYWTILKYIEPN